MRLLTDENFNGAILRGLVRRLPELDIVRVQDVGLIHTDDPDILEWAANEGRILLTHDVATITMYAYERVNQGLPMLGVIEVIATAPIGKIIDDLELFICCSQPDEYEGRIIFHPFPYTVIGLDSRWNLLYVVHVEREENVIRIISARKATRQERAEYEG